MLSCGMEITGLKHAVPWAIKGKALFLGTHYGKYLLTEKGWKCSTPKEGQISVH